MEQQAELAMPELMARLATAMTTLANVSTMQLASNLSTAKTIMRPSPFLGKRGNEACRFLAVFTMWATAQGTRLNTVCYCRQLHWPCWRSGVSVSTRGTGPR
jgi:hypothetical protein